MKLIALLRNPVERAYSAWNMFRQIHGDSAIRAGTIEQYINPANLDVRRGMLELLNAARFPDFDVCVRREIAGLQSGAGQAVEPSFVRRGLYAEQLRRFQPLFPRQNLLVLESTELRLRRQETLNRVLTFLGLQEWDWSQAALHDAHVREYGAKMTESSRALLQDFFRAANADLCSLLGRDFAW